MRHLTEEELILLHYGEPGASGRHLNECERCREAAAALSGTLNLCDEWTAPEAPPDFERTVWSAVAPRLADKPRPFVFPIRSAWVAAAIAALLLCAFLAGRASAPKPPAITAGLSKQARERILEISLADHLDRAGMLLTEISNTSYAAAPDFSAERSRAQDLVDEGRLMRQILASKGDPATLQLMDELERFLLEVANTPEEMTGRDIAFLQRRIDSGSLVFKVRVIAMNLRTEGKKS